jgi:hypothetical protein
MKLLNKMRHFFPFKFNEALDHVLYHLNFGVDSQLPILVHCSVFSPIRRKLQRQAHKLVRRRMINETKNKHKDICYTLILTSLKSHFQLPYNQNK